LASLHSQLKAEKQQREAAEQKQAKAERRLISVNAVVVELVKRSKRQNENEKIDPTQMKQEPL
jgi:hypothetical protein